MQRAVEQRKRARFRYHAQTSDAETEREIDPYAVVRSHDLWAVVGYCHLRRALRLFLLHRMRDLVVNPRQPKSPDFEPPADFDPARFSSVPPWRYAIGEPVTVELEVAGQQAWLAERELVAAGTPGSDGWCRFRVEATHPEALLEWTLALGPQARIVAPPELRARARDALAAVLAKLEEPRRQGTP